LGRWTLKFKKKTNLRDYRALKAKVVKKPQISPPKGVKELSSIEKDAMKADFQRYKAELRQKRWLWDFVEDSLLQPFFSIRRKK
jgi:hypothetical protein